jgi:hypothetical protein
MDMTHRSVLVLIVALVSISAVSSTSLDRHVLVTPGAVPPVQPITTETAGRKRDWCDGQSTARITTVGEVGSARLVRLLVVVVLFLVAAAVGLVVVLVVAVDGRRG